MPSLSPQDFEMLDAYEEEERQRRAAEAAQQQQPQAAQQQQPPTTEQTPREAAASAEKTKLDRGFFTDVGERLQRELDPLNRLDGYLDDVAELTGNETIQQIADFVPNRDEFRGKFADVPVLGQLAAAASAVDDIPLIPATVAARFANQDASFSELPAELKDVEGGEAVFQISSIVAPTLVGVPGGANVASRGAKVLAAESLLETLPQRSAEDLIAGREIAVRYGEIADLLGFEGAEVTKDLIEGKKPSAQVTVAVTGFIQNLGINFASDAIFGAIFKKLGVSNTSEAAEAVSKATGKPSDVVQRSLDDVEVPSKGNPDLDINEAVSLNTGVPRPTANKALNEDAIQASAIQRSFDFGDSGMATKDFQFFSNYKVFSDNTSYQKALADATKSLEPVLKDKGAMERAIVGGQKWVSQFFDETNQTLDLDAAYRAWGDDLTLEPLNARAILVNAAERMDGNVPSKADFVKNRTITSQEGTVAATLIGEELGIRLHQAARRVTNLEDGSIDFTKAVDDYLDLQDKAEFFLTPLRRFKAKWGTSGKIQQFDEVRRIGIGKQKDVKPLQIETPSYDAPVEQFSKVYKDTNDEGATLRELWVRYNAGDADAGNTLKTYFNLMSFAAPRTAVAQVNNLSNTLLKQLKKGNNDATTNLYYAAMLSRISPQTASLASNVVNLVKEPIGLFLSGDKAYAVGQVYGALSVFSDALQVGKRAFMTEVPVNAGSKLDAKIFDRKLRDLELDRLYEGVQKELNATNANDLTKGLAWWNYTRQKIANHPLNSYAGRGFLAADEWAKVVYGGMTASGRAFREASEKGVKRGTDEFKQLQQKQFNDIFRDGIEKGELNPATGVLDGANSITFATPIPKNGNFVDNAFRNLQDAADSSAFWKFVSPFTRVAYNTLEQGGVMLAGSIPGVGGEVLQRLIPRYRRIMNGEMGDIARLQLKSNLAFGQASAFAVVGLSFSGMMTGNNPPAGLPKTSFIVPAPGTKNGWVGIPYGRLEPIATPFAILSDLTTNYRDNIISEPDYEKAIAEVLTAFGLATLDKTFTSSLTNVASLLDVKNFSEGTAVSGVNAAGAVVSSAVLPIGAGSALTRMVADWVNPYQNYSKEKDNLLANVWGALANRNLGGATMPTKFDPYTGEKRTKVAGFGSNYWGQVLATIGNEAIVPGRLGDAKSNNILKQMDRIGFDPEIDLRSYKGIALSVEEQSILSKDLHDFGSLSKKLNDYFEGNRYPGSAIRKQSREGTQTKTELLKEQARQDVRRIINLAKDEAIREGRLSTTQSFQTKMLPEINDPLPYGETDGILRGLLMPTR